MRSLIATGLAVMAALALAAPAGALPAGGGPPIQGDHHSTCNGTGVTMVIPANATTFWITQSDDPAAIPLGHYLVQSVNITFDGVTTPYSFGTKAGFGDPINCVGTFDGYGIDSYDVLVS
jgi:hypothetical protein